MLALEAMIATGFGYKHVIRKTFKTISWIVGSLAGAGVALYVAAVVINWRDRDPSAAAIRFAELYRDRPAVADEDNAFIYLKGLSQDPLQNRLERESHGPTVQQFLNRCAMDSAECVAAFEASLPVFEEWLATESWVLERYRALLAHDGWRELVEADLAFPSFGAAANGQRLLLLNATVLADQGDAAAVSALLASDIRFWRNVLESADTLLTKMIATGALTRHFEWGNLVLRTFPPGSATGAIPPEWNVAITDSERSMLRCITGEWRHVSALLARLPDNLGNPDPLTDGLSSWAFAPLYQPQATANLFSDYYWDVSEVLDAPFDRYEAAANEASALAERTASSTSPPMSLYNVAGVLLIAGGPADFGSYGRRVADIEGVRRAALVTVTLRDEGVEPVDVAAALSASPLRSPFDDRPFLWDDNDAAVVFRGLEPGDRGEHRIYY